MDIVLSGLGYSTLDSATARPDSPIMLLGYFLCFCKIINSVFNPYVNLNSWFLNYF